MMMKNKQGQALSIASGVILSVVALFLLIWMFLPGLFETNIIEDVGCSLGVAQLAGQNQLLTPRGIEFVEVKCSPTIVELYSGDADDVGNLMHQCWDKFGSGNVDLKNKDEFSTICIYCGSIEAKEDISIAQGAREEVNSKERSLFSLSVHLNMNSLLEEDGLLFPESLSKGEKLDLFFVSNINPGESFAAFFGEERENKEKLYHNTASGLFFTESQSDFQTNQEFLKFDIKGTSLVCGDVIIPPEQDSN